MHVLVTGATGLIGSNLVPLLLEQGYKVKVLVRDPVKAQKILHNEVEICAGHLNDEKAIEKAMQGCRYLFHLAADYRLWVPDPQSMYTTNVDGTRLLMEKALEAGIERIVYTSSVCTLGYNADGNPANEELASCLDDMISPYKKSKFLAEKAVSRMVKEKGLPAVIVNPSTPVGPGDSRPTPTGAMILNTARDGGRFYAETGLNIAHVGDIAHGHVLALQKGIVGQRYILGGDNMHLKELFAITAHAAGKPGPMCKVPPAVLYPIAIISELLTRLGLVKEPTATLDSIRMASKIMFYSSQKAETELGYTHRPAILAVEDSIQWFKKNGMLD
ncbi:hopanoid-associated sugar epimerase [Maridesulfovibrio frigidus]|uniref:hopanoid-associated sugar epimerase n=1 Tax=Maridesulfovibrio frigidus TaxID=340956 RepID=UPI0004E0D748|nr:hopanoid-associated sugar epimerase [Maridesulfovibrio frigidus]